MNSILGSIDWQLLALSPPGWGASLLRGLLQTVEIALGAYAFGLLIGFSAAFGKIYGGPVLRLVLEIYTTMVRAVPELILILLLYYAGADLLNQMLNSFGYESVEISGLAAGIYVLGIVQGAYATEVLRGAMLAVPRGQMEAAAAFGMSWWQRQRRVAIPGALPHAIPGLANLWLMVTKDTALLAVVGFSELAQATRQAAGSTRSYFLFFVVAGVIYLLLTIISTFVIRRIERHYRRGQPELA